LPGGSAPAGIDHQIISPAGDAQASATASDVTALTAVRSTQLSQGVKTLVIEIDSQHTDRPGANDRQPDGLWGRDDPKPVDDVGEGFCENRLLRTERIWNVVDLGAR
jgi:hypothetical protein